jgi:hypothetical protein
LYFKLSLNPSRGPFITTLVGGSAMALTVIFSTSQPKIQLALSTKISALPVSRASVACFKLLYSSNSMVDSVLFLSVVTISSSCLKEKVKIIMTKGSTNDEPVKVTNINAFLNTFENAQGWVKNIEETSKKYEKTITDAMVVIQRKSGFKYITANDVDRCNKCVTMITHISTTGINTIQDALRTYYSTLKKIATFKPAKESAEEIKELFSAAF